VFSHKLHGRFQVLVNSMIGLCILVAVWCCSSAAASEGDHHYKPQMSPEASVVDHDMGLFGSDPDYGDEAYDAQRNLDIYGGKYMNPTQRPLLELGRELYQYGPFQKSPDWLGSKNLLAPQLLVYGDWRTAVAYNDNGGIEQATIATRLNLDFDLRLTATERVHVFMRPLDRGGKFTRLDLGGENHQFEDELDANIDTLFFEGDVGSILAGFSNEESKFDLPIAIGLMPLLFQNGVWLEDAFTGVAVTIPGRNSPMFDISNMDITLFWGGDRVTTAAIPDDDRIDLFGATAFIETMQGYWEVGYGYVKDDDNSELTYHNMAIAFTRRYRNILSNSVRFIAASGQDPSMGQQTADGFILLIENSFITSKPSTLVPYLNMFIGFDKPQSLARAGGAGGILKNTGILFETDGLTGFPKMDDTGFDTYGGAIGLEYLFSLDQQIVVEAAMVQSHGGENRTTRNVAGGEYGIGVRYQRPINNAMILRVDAMVAFRESADDLSGVRFEFRYKF